MNYLFLIVHFPTAFSNSNWLLIVKEEEEEEEGLKPDHRTQNEINNYVNKVVQENQKESLNPDANNENSPSIAQESSLQRPESVGEQKPSQPFAVTEFEELSPPKTNAER